MCYCYLFRGMLMLNLILGPSTFARVQWTRKILFSSGDWREAERSRGQIVVL